MPLNVVVAYFNPTNDLLREKNASDFLLYLGRNSNVKTILVEAVHPGTRTLPPVPCIYPSAYIRVTPKTLIWRKENLINFAVDGLNGGDCFAWIDADIMFSRMDWARIVLELFNKKSVDVLQLFSQIIWLNQRREISIIFNGSIAESVGGIKENKFLDIPDEILNDPNILPGHPGFAWAMTKKVWGEIGALPDRGIVGGGDTDFAYALLGHHYKLRTEKSSQAWKWYNDWALPITKLSPRVDYLEDLIIHNWHGDREKRQYVPRRKILIDANYDPWQDVEYVNGILELTNRGMRLQPAIKEFFEKRSE